MLYAAQNPWLLCGIGTLFCLSGVYLFSRNVYEKKGAVKWPVLIMLMGVLLIALGTAKYVKLF